MGEASQTLPTSQQHLRYEASRLFCSRFGVDAALFTDPSRLPGDRPRHQRLPGAAEGARGHHLCPPRWPQLPGGSASDGRSWYVVKTLPDEHFLFVFVNQRLISVILSICFSPSGKTTGIPIHVFGTETHMTAIVGMALGHRPIPNQPPVAAHTANFLLNSSGSTSVSCGVVRLCPRELPRHGLCVCSPQCSGLSDAQWLLCAFTPAVAGTRPVTHCNRPEASIKTASAQLSVERLCVCLFMCTHTYTHMHVPVY